MNKKNVNLSDSPNLQVARPPMLNIKSRVKAAMMSLNHNETPTKAARIKVKTR